VFGIVLAFLLTRLRCAWLVASFAAGVPLSNVSNGNSGCPLHIGLSIATFHRGAPVPCGAFVYGRRAVVVATAAALAGGVGATRSGAE